MVGVGERNQVPQLCLALLRLCHLPLLAVDLRLKTSEVQPERERSHEPHREPLSGLVQDLRSQRVAPL